MRQFVEEMQRSMDDVAVQTVRAEQSRKGPVSFSHHVKVSPQGQTALKDFPIGTRNDAKQ